MAYGLLYRYLFSSRQGYVVEVNISKKDYTGAVTKRALGRAPLLRRDNNGNISGTSLELYAECLTPGEYEQFYTSSADEYMVSLYRSGTKLWEGFVTPELYSEPDVPTPYDVRIIATDGLGELKRYNYNLTGTHSLREHLAYMLGKTGRERDILLSSTLQPASTESSYAANALLDVIKISLAHESGQSCYDVLQRMMSSLNAGITMYNNNWYIYRESDFLKLIANNSVRAYRGVDNIYMPVVPFGSMATSKWWPIGNMSSAIVPAKNGFELISPYNYYENLFKLSGWGESTGAYYDQSEEAYVLPSASSKISQKINFSTTDYVSNKLLLKLKARNTGSGSTESPLRIRVQISGKKYSGENTWYLSGTIPTAAVPNPAPYAWTTQATDIEYTLSRPSEADDKNSAQDIEVVIPLYYSSARAFVYAYDITVMLTNGPGTYGIKLYDLTLSQYDRAEGVKATVNIKNNAREKGSKIDLHMADTTGLRRGAKWLMPGVPLSPTGMYISGWYGGPLTKTEAYINAMAADYASTLGSIRRQYTGRLHVGDANIPALFSRDGVYYFAKSYSYDLYEDEMEVDLISIPSSNVEVELS